jgi:hypothetical protein
MFEFASKNGQRIFERIINMHRRMLIVSVILFVLFHGWNSNAQTLPTADIACEDLPSPRVYIEAGDTQMNMLSDLARKLRDADPPITLIYLPRSTCTLAANFFAGTPTAEVMRYVPSTSEQADYTGTPHQCTPPTAGKMMDLGIGATFISSCSQDIQNARPSDVSIIPGPVQGYGFIVPNGVADTVQAITREEAYFVFQGRGAWANAVPWVAEPNPSNGGTPTIYIRSATTSTLLTLASNVAPDLLPPALFSGYRLTGQADRSSVVMTGVSSAPENLRSATLGLLGLDLYDRNRGTLDVLAYRAKGQKYAYYPDSAPSKKDKRNVRDGYYVFWSYTEYITKVDSTGVALNQNVARILDIVQGKKVVRLTSQTKVSPAFDLDAIQVIATNGLVPDCAMEVSRKVDGGELSLYSPETSCGCYFEQVQDPSVLTDAQWIKRCPSCTNEKACSSGVCRRGFCEVK